MCSERVQFLLSDEIINNENQLKHVKNKSIVEIEMFIYDTITELHNDGLNYDQLQVFEILLRKRIQSCRNIGKIYIIQGKPGTGKS